MRRKLLLAELGLAWVIGGLLASGLPIARFREGRTVGLVSAQVASGPILVSAVISPTVESPALAEPDLTETSPALLADFGGGEYRLPDVPDLTEQQRADIQTKIDQNVTALALSNAQVASLSSTSLSWPVRGAAGLTDYGFHGMSAFVDHNAAYPNQLQDWNCGTRSYDLASGYNHAGTDIFTWPFGWYKMDHSEVEVVAAAPGTIVFRQDGNFDRSCGLNSNPWNAVYIRHADGSVAWYGHLKKNSVTAKVVGATVVQGEYLGIIGSSGSSTGPHLHFELHDAGGHVLDPYAGACGNTSSWWAAQRPYYDSAVNKLTTGSAKAVFPGCPNPETPNTQDQFLPGDTVYFTAYYRDQRSSQSSRYTIYKPDGTVYQRWTHASPASHYSASSWYWSLALGANVPLGLWTFEVVFNGQTYQHTFSVGKTLVVRGRPADRASFLDWAVSGSLPLTHTWQIAYTGPTGNPPSPVVGLNAATRAFTLTGLTNYAWYTVTVTEMDNAVPVMSSTLRIMPTDIFVYLPLATK